MNEELIHRVGVWIGRWISIAENIVVIFSFTYFIPTWEFKWMTFTQKAKMNRMNKVFEARKRAEKVMQAAEE